MTAPRNVEPRWGVARSLAFGCLAALGVVVWQLLLMGIFGAEVSFQLFAVLAACAFPVFVAPDWRAAFVSLAVSVPLGLGVLLLAHDATSTLVGAALSVGVARSVMFGTGAGRSLGLELVLMVTSLTAARLLGGGRPLELAVGVWTYCLVQSSYFLLAKPGKRRPKPAGDAFDLAHERASALLERRP